MIDVKTITSLQAETVKQWHEEEIDNRYDGFLNLVCRQHQQNFRLWHEEDIARSTDVTDAELAEVKRRIDKLNQRRNDLIEQLDDALIDQLRQNNVEPLPSARLNTETPGSAIDRLSILSLRIHHMQEQANREDAEPAHRRKATDKLEVLYQQLEDLSGSLAELLADVFAGRRLLKVYRQMKMYNDPTMNPYLYSAKIRPAA
ncbi:MAG: DUF4254 domain-containing protein [Pirellulales bacterium]|nr:DUF4254 domain-containing protein [Pirellulales bacterium]